MTFKGQPYQGLFPGSKVKLLQIEEHSWVSQHQDFNIGSYYKNSHKGKQTGGLDTPTKSYIVYINWLVAAKRS
jgi:hypothetical protein